jgi:hypothetical protein
MGRAKPTKEPTTLRKTGHNLSSSAVELCRTLADLLKTDESVLIEVGIRLIYDKLPASQKEAVSVILRAKGESLRGLRKLNNPSLDGEGEGTPSDSALLGRQADIDRVGRNSAAPVDAALETFRN